jgi:TonB-dependent receptor
MGDLPLPAGLRLITGVRAERWVMNMLNRQPPAGQDSIYTREELDILPSANLVVPVADGMNVRAAGYLTVSRPDPREIARGSYAPVAGQCTQVGNPGLNRAAITNADLRWEWFPGAGELVSVSGFYKLFEDPIVEIVAISQSDCVTIPINARAGETYGGELELRKGLGFVSPALETFTAGLNFTYAEGAADLLLSNQQMTLGLQDLSTYVGNTNLVYANPDLGLSASVLYNYFSDRISLYGDIDGNGNKTPDIVEEGRGTVDVKLSKTFGPVSASISASNLTNELMVQTQRTAAGPQVVGMSEVGTSLSLSLGFSF